MQTACAWYVLEQRELVGEDSPAIAFIELTMIRSLCFQDQIVDLQEGYEIGLKELHNLAAFSSLASLII